MREVLSLATFVLGVLCFVAFVIAVKPNAFAAAEAPNKPAHKYDQPPTSTTVSFLGCSNR